jgi:hypothetical protein
MARFTSALLRLTTAITTANLRKLALALKGSVKPASNYRRIQRFLSDYAVDFRALGRLLVHLLPQQPPYVVVVDRTEWHFGRAPVNVLTVGIAHRGISFPIAFAALPAGGGSSADEQIEVLERFLRVVEPAQVKAVQVKEKVADREFIGAQWLCHLKARKIPFVVRLRSDRCVGRSRQGPALRVCTFPCTLRVGQTRRLKGKRFYYRSDGSAVDVEVVMRRLAYGRPARSLFRYGLDRLQEILLTFEEYLAAFQACLSALHHPSAFLSCT